MSTTISPATRSGTLLTRAQGAGAVRLDLTATDFGSVPAVVFIDGVTAGDWTVSRNHGNAALTIRPYARLSQRTTAALTDEGTRPLNFADANTQHVEINAEILR